MIKKDFKNVVEKIKKQISNTQYGKMYKDMDERDLDVETLVGKNYIPDLEKYYMVYLSPQLIKELGKFDIEHRVNPSYSNLSNVELFQLFMKEKGLVLEDLWDFDYATAFWKDYLLELELYYKMRLDCSPKLKKELVIFDRRERSDNPSYFKLSHVKLFQLFMKEKGLVLEDFIDKTSMKENDKLENGADKIDESVQNNSENNLQVIQNSNIQKHQFENIGNILCQYYGVDISKDILESFYEAAKVNGFEDPKFLIHLFEKYGYAAQCGINVARENNEIQEKEVLSDVNVAEIQENSEEDYIDYDEYLQEVKKVLFEYYAREVPNSIFNEFMREIENNHINFESKDHVIDLFETYGYAKKYGFSKKNIGAVPDEFVEEKKKKSFYSYQEKTIKKILIAKYGKNLSEEAVKLFRKEIVNKGIVLQSYDQVSYYFEKFGYAEKYVYEKNAETSKDSKSLTQSQNHSNEAEKKNSQEEKQFEKISENSEKFAEQFVNEKAPFVSPDINITVTDYYSDLVISLGEIERTIYFLEEDAKKATQLSDIVFEVFEDREIPILKSDLSKFQALCKKYKSIQNELNKISGKQYSNEESNDINKLKKVDTPDDFLLKENEMKESLKRVRKIEKPKKKFDLKNKIFNFLEKIKGKFSFAKETGIESSFEEARMLVYNFLNNSSVLFSEAEDYNRFLHDVSNALSSELIEKNEESIKSYFINNGYGNIMDDSNDEIYKRSI